MRFLYIFPVLCALAFGSKLFENEVIKKNIFKEEILHLVRADIVKLAKIESRDDLISSITANLNDYLDAVLLNVNRALTNAGLNAISLEDQTINIGIGKSTLTNGVLSKLATIERYEDVTVSYDSKKITLDFILRWEDLKLDYDYHTKVVLIKINGGVSANVAHMKIHLKLSFDFNTYHIKVDDLDFNHTGSITLKFTGHKIIDNITNAMTKVFTTIFHNLIIKKVRTVIMDPVTDIVDEINQAIDNVLKKTV